MLKNKSILFFSLTFGIFMNSIAQDTIMKFFPNSSKKIHSFHGKVIDFDLAKESGNYAVLTSEDSTVSLSYYGGDTLLWNKKLPQNVVRVKISDDGNTVLTYSLGKIEATLKTTIFDNKGNYQWRTLSEKAFFLSPDGNHLCYQLYESFMLGTKFQIYTKKGNLLWKNLPAEFNEGEFFIRFIDNQRVFVLKQLKIDNKYKQKLMMVNFTNLKIEWEYDIENYCWMDTFNGRNSDSKKNTIIFFGRTSSKEPNTIFSFSLNGELRWKNTTIEASSVKLSDDERYVFVYRGSRHENFFILDNQSGHLISKIKIEPSLSYLSVAEIYNNKLVVSGKTFKNYVTNYYLLDNDLRIKKFHSESGITKINYHKKFETVKLISSGDNNKLKVYDIK